MEINEELDKYRWCYAQGPDTYAMKKNRNFQQTCSEFLDKWSMPGMRYLDVSCGRGELLEYGSKRKGLVSQGTEGVEENCTPNGRVQHCLLPGPLPFHDDAFHIVTNVDVLEHLRPWEILPTLREIVRVTSGRAYIRTNCIAARKFVNPDGSQHFVKNQMVQPDVDAQVLHLHISRFPEQWWRKAMALIGEEFGCHVEVKQRGRKFTLWIDKGRKYIVSDVLNSLCLSQPPNFFWYDSQFPIVNIPNAHKVSLDTLGSAWWPEFMDDIADRGIQSPVLLLNDYHANGKRRYGWEDYHIRDGNHRIGAAERLGHLTVPAIVYGMHIPHEWEDYKLEPLSYAQANDEYITDGRITFDDDGLPYIKGARTPSEVAALRS